MNLLSVLAQCPRFGVLPVVTLKPWKRCTFVIKFEPPYLLHCSRKARLCQMPVDPSGCDANCATIAGLPVGPSPDPVQPSEHSKLIDPELACHSDHRRILRQIDAHLDPVSRHQRRSPI